MISERIALLAAELELGRPFGPDRPGLIQARAGSHTILYRVRASELLIVSVLHGRQDHARRLSRRKTLS